jgi:hypothetical protein
MSIAITGNTYYYANGASVVEYEYEGKKRYTPQVNGEPVTSRSFIKLSAARKAAVAAASRRHAAQAERHAREEGKAVLGLR